MPDAARIGIAADLEHDPSYERQRKIGRFLLGAAINRLRGRGYFEDTDRWTDETLGAALAHVAIEEGIILFDDLHHAPICPANNFHRARLPTAPCTCGATRTMRNV